MAETYDRLAETQRTLISVVERTIREIQFSIWHQHEEAKKNITAVRISLEQSLKDKFIQLSPQDLALCLRLNPECRLVLGDCRAIVTETILSCAQVVTGSDDLVEVARKHAASRDLYMAKEVMDFAKTLGIANGPSYKGNKASHEHKTTKKLIRLLANTVTEEEIRTLTAQWETVASAAMEAGSYQTARRKLEKAKELLETWNLSSPEVNLKLGLVLSVFGNTEEAVTLIRSTLSSLKLTEPDSELTLRCAAYLVETLYHTSQNELARVEALQISLDWSESEHYFQLWKVFCYFTFCHVSNDTSPLEVREITTNWIQTLFIVNDQCECIKWIILGIVNMEENRMDEASQLLEKGLTKCLPNSFITASG